MTIGIMATADSSSFGANTNYDMLTLPAGAGAQSFDVEVTNRNNFNVMVRIAPLCASGTPADSEWAVYDCVVKARKTGVLKRQISGGAKHVVVRSDSTGVSFNVKGTT